MIDLLTTLIVNYRWLGITLLCVCLLVALFRLLSVSSETRVLYSDTGPKSQVFSSQRFKLLAKPDVYEEIDNSYRQIREYKSRENGFYQSDRVQLVASAIALIDSGFPVDRGVLETRNGEQHVVRFNQNVDILFEEIEDVVLQTRKAIAGLEPIAKPTKGKCRVCSFSNHCPYSAA